MPLAHVTKTGNVSIPKKWRQELGIEPDSGVVMLKLDRRIVIEPLKVGKFSDVLKKIDDEVRKKKAVFSIDEAVRDDLHD